MCQDFRLIEDLLALLARADEDEEIVSCACGILSNLTCNNVHNKQTVCEAGGVTTLIDVAGRSANIEDITVSESAQILQTKSSSIFLQEPALCTLRHCTVRNPHAKAAQTELVTTPHGYQIILSLLATRRPPIVKAALGVARNCAIQEANLSTLINVSRRKLEFFVLFKKIFIAESYRSALQTTKRFCPLRSKYSSTRAPVLRRILTASQRAFRCLSSSKPPFPHFISSHAIRRCRRLYARIQRLCAF